jgi:hypothetical protein
MTTFAIGIGRAARGWAFPSLGRFLTAISGFIDAYAEALQQVHAVRQRYPFASE